jgi:hypothetical protein
MCSLTVPYFFQDVKYKDVDHANLQILFVSPSSDCFSIANIIRFRTKPKRNLSEKLLT